MSKKKILFYYKLFFAGGTEHSILKLIKKLYKDFDIYVAYDEEGSVDIVLKEISQYSKIIDLNEIDKISVDTCIWCSYSSIGSFGEFSKKVMAKHYMFWCHILLFETYPNIEFTQEFRDNIEKFICVSNIVKNDIIKKYPDIENKCEIIENYLDYEEILEKSKESIEININHQKLNFITVSRLHLSKRFWANENIM